MIYILVAYIVFSNCAAIKSKTVGDIMNFQELEQNFHDIISSCEYGESFVYQMLFDLNHTDIYLPEINRPMSSRKLD